MSNQQVDKTDQQKKNVALPGFMSENSKIDYNEEPQAVTWLANNLTRLMIGISVLWFIIVLIYITQFFGWSNLFLMMPDEFGGFLAGVTLPLAIIWVVMAYIDRGASFKNEAKFLRAYMNQLVYPEEGGAQTAKAMADAIRSQVGELQAVTKHAMQQTEIIKKELSERVNDFSKLVSTLDNYSSHTIVELTDGVKTLVENFDYVTARAQASSETFKGYIGDFSSSAQLIEQNCQRLFEKITPNVLELKQSSQMFQSLMEGNAAKISKANQTLADFGDLTVKSVENVAQLLDAQTAKLQETAKGAVDVCDVITQKIDGSVNKIENVLGSQTSTVEEYLDKIDNVADSLSERFSSQSKFLSSEVEKVASRANIIAETVGMQVQSLENIADKISENIKSVENNVLNGKNNVAAMSENIIHNLEEIVAKSEVSTERLSALSEQNQANANSIKADINSQNENLQKVSDGIMLNFKLLMQEFKNNINALQEQTDVARVKLDDVSGIVKKNIDNLNEASSLVVAQSKVGENAIAQQQNSIEEMVKKIEAIKAELKYQIDELMRTSSFLGHEAGNTVETLKKQLSETYDVCNNIVSKTQLANSSLNDQAAQFNEKADMALGKVARMESILNNQSQEMEKLVKSVAERSVTVAETMERHAANVNIATANSETTLQKLNNSFAVQNENIGKIAEATVKYVADVVQAMDEKAENISLLFKQQENEFFNICDRLTENTDNMGNTLKKQVSVIEQSADKVFSRMTLLEEDVNKRVDAVVANTVKSIDKLAEVNQSITVQNNDVSKFIQEITDKMALISATFRDNFQIFNDTVKDLTLSSDGFTASIMGNCDKINQANQNLVQESKNTITMLDSHAQNIDSFLSKTITQSDLIKDSFERQGETLADIANTVAAQTRLGEASLAQQYKYLSDASTEVAERINEINKNMKDGTDNILENSAKIAYEFNVLGDRLLKVNEDINKSSKDSIKNVEQMNMALSQLVDDFGANVNKSSAKIATAMNDYEKYIANFNTVTAEASSGVFEINNLISSQSDKMIKISEDTKQLVECFNTVLNDTSVQLSNRANFAYEKVKGLGENLKTLSLQMDEASKMTTTNFENTGNKLRATITEIASNAERISNEIRSSGEVFLKQSGVLVAAGDDTLKKVTDVMNVLNNSSSDFSASGDELIKKSVAFSDIIEKQLKVLTETAQKAEKNLTDMEKRYENAQIDTFLKDAAYIIEKLETSSVDINRIFNPNAEEEIWKKYYNGDTSAFVRYLAKNMTKQQILEIRKLYEKNMDFRNMVTKYLSDFETLVARARMNEHAGVLLSVISGADIGKVYYILAKALDKLN